MVAALQTDGAANVRALLSHEGVQVGLKNNVRIRYITYTSSVFVTTSLLITLITEWTDGVRLGPDRVDETDDPSLWYV